MSKIPPQIELLRPEGTHFSGMVVVQGWEKIPASPPALPCGALGARLSLSLGSRAPLRGVGEVLRSG